MCIVVNRAVDPEFVGLYYILYNLFSKNSTGQKLMHILTFDYCA
jgi:hypothetical protein